jgi:hypothetical protein
MARLIDGVLLLHQRLYPSAPDIAESVRAFKRFSRFPVFPVNVLFGYPDGLDRVRFRAVVLHYTMFYADFEPLGGRVRALLADSGASFKVALFQDEQAYLAERLELCSEYALDCVYTCFEPPHAERVYGGVAPRVRTCLPGYASEDLRAVGTELAGPDSERPIDVGYRGRRPPSDWGPEAREKYEVAVEFKRRAESMGLALDIETDEEKRIYGSAWPRFIANCKATLGTESGATVRDPRGGEEPIPYRTISPRHFEAAALRSCQILYEGAYSGILHPMVHYIPLRKDFSNFDEVIERFREPELRERLTEAAFRDLIASDRFSYRAFVRSFDEELVAAGLEPAVDPRPRRVAARAIYGSKVSRRVRRYEKLLRLKIDELRAARRRDG